MTSRHPVTQLFFNTGLATSDFSQLAAIMKARDAAEFRLSGVSENVRNIMERKDDDEGNKNRPSQKRNPNDLSTAPPVTSMDDFTKVPITTKLNNLKLPGKERGKFPSAAVPNRPLKVFHPDYLPKDEDVVVDMAHYPNREFRNVIRQALPNYLTSSQPKRKLLIAAILQAVSCNGGHFIRFWSSRQSWVEVENVHAERFAAQALQDAVSQRGSCVPSDLPRPSSCPLKVASRVTVKIEATPSKATQVRRISMSELERKSISSMPRASPMQEIPIIVRKRPSQTAPCTNNPDDRSALLVKFKRPKVTPRKVSLHEQNPLTFLSQIASLDDGEWDGSDCS